MSVVAALIGGLSLVKLVTVRDLAAPKAAESDSTAGASGPELPINPAVAVI